MINVLASIASVPKSLCGISKSEYMRHFGSLTKSLPDSFNNKTHQIQNSDIGKNIAMGLGVVGLVTAAAIKTFKPYQIKQFAEHIDFREAKNIYEAKKFARDNFGIKLEADNDLFTANMINEVCTNVSNKMKGKLSLPQKIVVQDENMINKYGRKCRGEYNVSNDTIYINKQTIAGKYTIPDTGEKISLSKWLNGLAERGSSYSKIKTDWENSPYSFQQYALFRMKHCIAHEIGHCNHFNLNKTGYWMSVARGKEFQTEINKPEIKEVCQKFFHSENYAKNPLEFVADTFAFKISGRDIPKEIEKIYKNCGGISVPFNS